MLRRKGIRWMAALVLAAGLAGPALAAPGSPKAAQESGGWWKAAASWLAGAWSGLEDAAAVVTRGLSVDPNGGTANSESDRGLMIDPNGGTSSSESDRGFMIDPDG